MNTFDNDTKTRNAFQPMTPHIAEDGSISAFKSGDTSALRALETIVEPGTVIGNYRVGRLLGRGGIAAVYDGTQLDIGNEIAMKILDARFTASAEVVEKFLSEGETLSGFNHQNIVHYVDRGRDDTFVYVVMELVKGITLDQLIHAIELKKHHYVHIAGEVGKGLTMIHSRGLVHGDIKPSNILVTRPGEVKISDFGTASRAIAAGGARSTVSGTSSYMAPELFNPRHSVDHHADIYSLGVTFYKVLTGKLPADPWIPARELNPELPDGIDAVLLRALQKNPEDRHVTVKEFSDALAAAFDKDAVRTPVEITPDKEAVEATAAMERQRVINAMEKARKEADTIDWKMIALCGMAAVGLAAVLLGLAVFYGMW